MCEIVDVFLNDLCGTNQGGTKLRLHYAQVSDFLSIKKPAADGVGILKYTIVEPHTFKSTKNFKTIEMVMNTGAYTISEGGENSGTKAGSVVLRVPSNLPNATLLFNLANGISPFIFLIEDANMPDGTYDQLGAEKMHATLKATKIPGANNGEGSMYEFTISTVQPYRILYTAAVTTTPAA